MLATLDGLLCVDRLGEVLLDIHLVVTVPKKQNVLRDTHRP